MPFRYRPAVLTATIHGNETPEGLGSASRAIPLPLHGNIATVTARRWWRSCTPALIVSVRAYVGRAMPEKTFTITLHDAAIGTGH